MQHFFVKSNDRVVFASYPNIEDVAAIEQLVSELTARDAERFASEMQQARDFAKNGEYLKCIPVLQEIAKSFPDSYMAHFIFGEILQSLGIYMQSLKEYYLAFANTNNEFFKLQSTSRKMRSLKKLGDYCVKQGHPTLSAVHYLRAVDAYCDSCNWQQSATPAEAVYLQYNYASLFCSILALSLHAEAKDAKVSGTLLDQCFAAKELSMQVADYYGIKDIGAEHAALEKDLQTLEMKVAALENF